MRILNVVKNLDKGGTQRAAQNFCEGYAALGHDSKMLAKEGGIRKAELEKENIHVWIGMSTEVLKEIQNWKPEVIHLHSHGITYDDVVALKQICGDCKFIETNVFSKPTDYSDFLSYSYQLADWCQFLYLAHGGSKKICVKVPYPVKTKSFYEVKDEGLEFRKKYNIPEDIFLFGRVGQNIFGKWSLYLIDVFQKFNTNISSNSMLLLINPATEVIEYVDYLGIANKVIIIDKLYGDDELRKCYSSIDVFLHIANQGESFGLVLAESLLCKTPVITLNTPWRDNSQAEVVGDSIGGFCCNTLKEFYARMKILYQNTQLRLRLGEGGRQHIIDNFDYLAVSKESINLISLEEKAVTQRISISDLGQHKSYSKPLTPLLWMKMHLGENKVLAFLLRRAVNFKWKTIN